MTLGEKILKQRREKNYTQEQLAELLGVSRQAVSKWESDTVYPETEKLLRMGSLFGCSMDYLLKAGMETDEPPRSVEPCAYSCRFGVGITERKSKRTVFGMPLWHVGKNARGVFAVGLHARGIVSLGLFSVGIFSFGLFSVGLLSIGVLAIGLLAAGSLSVGVLSAGAISLGIISLGAVAVGEFSAGALAIGRYFAIGDNAQAMIAVGQSEAAGSVYRKIGHLGAAEAAQVRALLDIHVPDWLAWAKAFIGLFL